MQTDELDGIKHSFGHIFQKAPVSSSCRYNDANLKKQDTESALREHI